MFGVLLASIASFFEEISSSLGKAQVRRRAESIYAMGFLDNIWGTLFFFVLLIIHLHKGADISLHSPWTFTIRAALSLVQSYVTVKAIALCDRSTYGFVRTGAIPLLLAIDLLLGYMISPAQLLGMVLIVGALFFLFMNHGLSKKGMGFLLIGTVNAAAVLALYKYDISHGNTLALEQFSILLLQTMFFYLIVRIHTKENLFRMLKKPALVIQAAAIGFSDLFGSFAYVFAPASVILAAERSSAVVWCVLAGKTYFHEKKGVLKFVATTVFVIGIVLLTVSTHGP